MSNRAAVIGAPRRTHVVETPLPALEEQHVRVRLQGCGICASNLPVWEGRSWFSYPLQPGAPGHEGWGIVHATGSGVSDVAPGERVSLVSQRAYAQFDVAPRAAVVRLPGELGREPFPGEPLGCAMNVFRRSEVRRGQRVAIVGAGFLGVLLTQLAVRAGAEVFVTSRRESSLEWARRAGAHATFPLSSAAEVCAEAARLTGGRGFQRVVEAAGEQVTLDAASGIAGEHARLVIAGYHQDGPRQVNMQEWNWRGLDVVNAHERTLRQQVTGIEDAVAAVLEGRLDPFPLFSHAFGLGALDDAFALLRLRPAGFMKALVTV